MFLHIFMQAKRFENQHISQHHGNKKLKVKLWYSDNSDEIYAIYIFRCVIKLFVLDEEEKG